MLLFGFLLLSAAAGVGVLAWGAYNLSRRPRRLAGVVILGAGCVGTLGALALYWTMFLMAGGEAKNLLSEVALLWAGAGFAWAGFVAAVGVEARRVLVNRGAGSA